MDNLCDYCGRMFTQLHNLYRHIREVHQNEPEFTCKKCDRRFHRASCCKNHEKKCIGIPQPQSRSNAAIKRKNTSKTYGVPKIPRISIPVPSTSRDGETGGGKQARSVDIQGRSLVQSTTMDEEHGVSQSGGKVGVRGRHHVREYRCRLGECSQRFNNRGDLLRHRVNVHTDPDHEREEWSTPHPWIVDGEEDVLLRRLLEDSRMFIFDRHRHGSAHSIFNFALNPRNWIRELTENLRVVRNSTQEAIKLNLSLGMVLRHIESGEYRYFVAAGNVPLLTRPERIDTQADWDRFQASLEPDYLIERIIRERPSTKWRLLLVTNMRVDVASLGVNMGAGDIPDYIRHNRSILSLGTNQNGGEFTDGSCAFRALAAYRNLKQNRSIWYQLETETAYLRQVWGSKAVNLNEMCEFETVFGLCVDIYSLDSDGAVYPRYLSQRKGSERMVMNLYNEHLSLVQNVNLYLSKYKCVTCEKHFKSLTLLKRHQGRCARSTRIDFSHEHYKCNKTVFEELREVGIEVESSRQVFPYFASFDLEALLHKIKDDKTAKMDWIARHDAISASICSNITGYREPRCYVNVDQVELTRDICCRLEELSDAAYEAARTRWSRVFELLEAEPTDENIDPEVKKLISSEVFRIRRDELYKKFDGYCKQLPILGFRSASYDLNLLKGTLFRALRLESNDSSVIKKNNSYTSIGTSRFRFLDISNYLAPGFSYAQFLKAYDISETKSYFCYEWFDDVSKLDYPSLPDYEDFYSTLKKVNVLDQADGEDEEDGEELGRRRHGQLKDIWREKGMTTFRDFLEYYNNLDTYPMVLAIEKMQQFYFDQGIDMFKIAISVPGIARRMLHNAAVKEGVSFSSIRPGDDDMYYLIKKNVVGGPSLVFTREHEVGRTWLRGNPEILCNSILGLDCNALYLNCISKNMPTGDYIRRFAPSFAPVYKGNKRDMFTWLDFVSHTEGIEILHGRNHGEVQIGQYFVDGYEPKSKTILEFEGCYYHGCDRCGLGSTDWRIKKAAETKERREWLERQGYEVRVMKEHDFNVQKKEDEALRRFEEERLPPFYRQHRGGTTAEIILEKVRQGPKSFFGLLEVDIHCPENLTEYFSEMCPIFCNTDINFADIGLTMQNYAKSRKISQKTRRLLVGGLAAERILFSSELLAWYLKKGMIVTKIHQVIEYRPVRCFRKFVRDVTEARRRGDIDLVMKIIGETQKLVGNSAYGSLLIDKEQHLSVKYHTDFWKTQQAINSSRFRKLSEVSEDLYEVSSSKARIRMDLPYQCAFMILQAAKLCMLEFYYDCLDKLCGRSNFEMIEMDTDSAYFAIGGSYVDGAGERHPVTKLEHFMGTESCWRKMYESCNEKPYTAEEGHFFPRVCCQKHRQYDSRTPGLFKLEAEGDVMVGLCSKTYVLQKRNSLKLSTKGLRKGALENPVDVFKNVLRTGVPASGTNVGFRVRGEKIYTYEQERAAISYFYCKREVMPDGIHTKPLAITLCPWSKRNLDIVGRDHPLWPDREIIYELSFGLFHSLFKVCYYLCSRVPALLQSKKDEMVKEALNLISDYEPAGELVFVAEGSFGEWKNKGCANVWTCGMGARCSELVPYDGYRGLNRLGELFMEIQEE